MTGPEPLIEGAAVLLVDRAGRILLQQRDDAIPPAGYGRWALPGGRVEPGETPMEAALREMEEETGLRLRGIEPFAVFDYASATPGQPRRRVHVFVSGQEVDEGAIQVHEGLDFRFQAAEAIPSLPMNPLPREVLSRFLASDVYRRLAARPAAGEPPAVAIIALDRWGRVLLQGKASGGQAVASAWSIPAGPVAGDEPPDAAALRVFEEATGLLLEDLRLFRRAGGPGRQHIYYCDPDIDLEMVMAREGLAFRYATPAEASAAGLDDASRDLLAEFFASPAYRALFH